MSCYCGQGKAFEQCCQPILQGVRAAKTAETLMRSRYSAYVLCLEPYLLKTWHASQCPDSIEFDPQQKWLGLKIVATIDGQDTDNKGDVEFVARYKQAGKAYRLHEKSQFVRQGETWFYTTGEILDT